MDKKNYVDFTQLCNEKLNEDPNCLQHVFL